jgi:plasmid stability protein
MSSLTKRSTVYLDPELHRALRIKAAETERSVSELVNEAVKYALIEDSMDLKSFEERKDEPLVRFEDVLKKLKKNGKI